MSKNLPKTSSKIAPKMIKNPSKIDPQRAPETLLERRSLLGPLICTFLAPFGTPKGPQNRSKIDHFLDLFLNDFLEPLFHAFGLHLGSQKRDQKETQDQNTKIIDFAKEFDRENGTLPKMDFKA